jgi:hypothetical protein
MHLTASFNEENWMQTVGGLPEENGAKVKARWRRSGDR